MQDVQNAWRVLLKVGLRKMEALNLLDDELEKASDPIEALASRTSLDVFLYDVDEIKAGKNDRHGGSCPAHTDNTVLTLIASNEPGLECFDPLESIFTSVVPYV